MELATRQDSFVSSRSISNLELFSLKYIEDYWKLKNWKLGQDKTKLSCLVTNSVHTADTVLCCPCRKCEQAITVTTLFTVFLLVLYISPLILLIRLFDVNGPNGRSRPRLWEAHGEHGAQTYNRVSEQSPQWGPGAVRGLPEAERLSALSQPEDSASLS